MKYNFIIIVLLCSMMIGMVYGQDCCGMPGCVIRCCPAGCLNSLDGME
uniref:4Fe-4S ferredoxin-type domain-containing protein n=1 Tax=Meloidogyne hapla TaxID=6305 RepID=A0A1I8BKC8_MELHA